MLNKYPKHLPSCWPKFIPRMKSDQCKGSEQIKATQTMAMEKNDSACYVYSFICSCSFFLFLHLFFYFLQYFFQPGAQENEPQKISQQLDVISCL